MSTAIENLTGIQISSEYFTNKPNLKLFPPNAKQGKINRVALVYGRNGSGKSTISQGFYEYANSINPKNVELNLLTGDNYLKISSNDKPNKVFVFNENYVDKNVKIKTGGLDTIILLGKQVGLEEEILEVEESINDILSKLEHKKTLYSKYEDQKDVASPDYWLLSIKKDLQTKGWAENLGIKINGNSTKARVTDQVIEEIKNTIVTEKKEDLLDSFDSKLNIFFKTDKNTLPINNPICELNFDKNIEKISIEILSKIVSKPQLTQREQQILDLFGITGIVESKEFLSDKTIPICPTCLREMTTPKKEEILKEINNIINEEFDAFQNELKKLDLPIVDIEKYLIYKNIDELLYNELVTQLSKLNSEIEKHNDLINNKKNQPFEKIEYKNVDVVINYIETNRLLKELEKKRISFNMAVNDRDNLKNELKLLNNKLAKIDLVNSFKELKNSLTKKESEKELKSQLEKELSELIEKKDELDAKRKDFKIAVDELNSELEFIFFSKNRLELKLENELYHLRSRGHSVEPNRVSCGERNALALCYFFADIAKNMNADNLYKDEMLIVIDDPVSSFDFENKIGILSFLKIKLKQILQGCKTSKVLIMTHDLTVMDDLIKTMEEISRKCKQEFQSAEFNVFQLHNKNLLEFEFKHNEYTQLLNSIYNYAKSPSEAETLTIGNHMRRVLEAFSTFSYKKSMEEISTNQEILDCLPNEQYKDHFENLMYRLALNNESHFYNTARFLPQTDFFPYMSDDEKQRIAKELLVFMFMLNEQHIKSHLPNALSDIKLWESEIIKANTP